MDTEDKDRETRLESYEDRFQKLKSENDRLVYQLKKTEEENYAKTLQLASQRQLIESLQEKLTDSKTSKPVPTPKPDENSDLQIKINELNSKCLILEQINEETVKKSQKDVEIWQMEAESARKQMRKIEDELYQSRKLVGELEEFKEKYKKEVSEKEKLVSRLDGLNKANKELEENARNHKEQFLQLTEIVEKDTSAEELNKVKKEFAEMIEKHQRALEDIETHKGLLQKLKKEKEELDNKHLDLQGKLEVSEKKSKELEVFAGKSIELEGKIAESEKIIRLKDSLIEKIQQESLEQLQKNMIIFKIDLAPQENLEDPQEKLMEWERKYLKVAEENEKYQKDLKNFEAQMKASLEDIQNMCKSKCLDLETQCKAAKEKYKRVKQDLQTLNQKLKSAEKALEEKDFSLSQITQDMYSTKKQLNILQEDCSSYNSVISQLNMEKNNLETQTKQKDSKFKALSSKIQFLESQLHEKNKEIITKDNELINADRQMELLKKKINSSSTRIKQIATEQIDSQRKKLDNYESEIKMLKEMLKSVQSELKYKQQEVLKLKKPSPRKKDLFEESPLQVIKGKVYQQEAEHKFFVEPIKESPFKKQSLNIFKAKSPFSINSKKALVQDEIPSLLKHIVKGYLTSYVLCEKEKKEMMKLFSDLDQNRRGVLDKNLVLSKCEDAMFDTSLLGVYGKEVDYKDFLEMNYHNQLQQIHRDLEINFSQILPGTISVSELKLMKQALRPLHRQIWDVIVERIGTEYPKEVDLFVVKQVLSQAQISL